MATSGTVHEGLDFIVADRVYISGSNFTLVAYANAGDSLSDESTYSDLILPQEANGYAPIVLDGTWGSMDGIVTYTHSGPDNPTWTATGAWNATITGVAVIEGTFFQLLHFKDLDVPFTASANRKLAIDLNTVVG